MEFPWGHDRRFNTYSAYFKKVFGERIQKVSINAGFTCPNRDGSIGEGGCSFCNNDAFHPSYCQPEVSITEQINTGARFHLNRYRTGKFIAYFQAYSNTYGDFQEIKKKYEEALSHPHIIGLVIGTRPDCIDEEKLDYFKELSKKHYIIIEYGIESVYNKTLERINRGHDFETSIKAIEMTASRGLKVGSHLIFGLPGESRDEMLESANILSELPLTSIKFHQLQIIEDTLMAGEFREHPEHFNLFSFEEYKEFIIRYLERLNPEFVVERLSGESPPQYIINEPWGLRSDKVMIEIENRMKELNTWQGKLYKK
jgi:radical SAM protein (TIGR01212 family)